MGLDQQLAIRNGEDYEPIAYFRKVNFLHGWAERELNDGAETNCDYLPISGEQLNLLRRQCEAVLADPSKAGDLLATQGGFFFGSTEYGEYYLADVKDVLTACERALQIIVEHGESPVEICYWSWW